MGDGTAPVDLALPSASASSSDRYMSTLCQNASAWCGECCLRHAVHAGAGLAAFREQVRELQSRIVHKRKRHRMQVSVVGNSVARASNYQVARGLVKALALAAPRVIFKLDTSQVAGGFEPDHFYHCGLQNSSLARASIVLLFYHAPRGGVLYEKLLRGLLALPKKPLIVYIQHCTMQDFGTFREWQKHPLFRWFPKAETPSRFEAMRAIERRLVDHYQLTRIDTCAAFQTMLRLKSTLGRWDAASSNCTDRAAKFEKVTELLQPFYLDGAPYPRNARTLGDKVYGDPCHLGAIGGQVQACAVAHAMLDAPAPPPPRATSRYASLPVLATNASDWSVICGTRGEGQRCMEVSDEVPQFCMGPVRLSTQQREGWDLVRGGGAGHQKTWLQGRNGSHLRVRLPQPAAAVIFEFYQHHEKPMGAAVVTAPGIQQRLDGCTSAENVPFAQGKYTSLRVPAVGRFEVDVQELNVTVIAQSSANQSVCSELVRWLDRESNFSLATVIGLQRREIV